MNPLKMETRRIGEILDLGSDWVHAELFESGNGQISRCISPYVEKSNDWHGIPRSKSCREIFQELEHRYEIEVLSYELSESGRKLIFQYRKMSKIKKASKLLK